MPDPGYWAALPTAEAFRAAADDHIPPAPAGAPSIAVLGAGISGLVAAYELARKGYRVQVFEANSRVGGRIMTARYENAHAELGAMRIPASHHGTHHYINLLQLDTAPFKNSDNNTLIRVRGTTLGRDTASREQLADLYELGATDRHYALTDLAFPLYQRVAQLGLTEAEQADIRTSRIAESTDRVRDLDTQTVHDFLVRTNPVGEPSSVDFFADVNYLKDIWQAPVTALVKEFVGDRGDGLSQIRAGMDLLPQHLLALLEQDFKRQVTVHLQTQVIGIQVAGQTTTLTLSHMGEPRQETFDYALCTLPFGVLRHIMLTGISTAKASAIDRFRYAPATKVLLNFSERFWESLPAPILGGSSLTDGIAAQIYYPTATSIKTHPADSSKAGLLPNSALFPRNLAPTHTTVPDTGPGVLIGSYAWGRNAERLGAMSHEHRLTTVLDCLRDLHGSVVDDYFAGTGASMAWGQNPYSAGAYAQGAPRDLLTLFNAAQTPEHHLYFCGEHLSSDPGWINGSVNSTLSTVQQLTNAICQRC